MTTTRITTMKHYHLAGMMLRSHVVHPPIYGSRRQERSFHAGINSEIGRKQQDF